MRKGIPLLTMIMIIASITIGPFLSINPVNASPFTTVNVSLQSDPPCVDVSPGSSGMVYMDGEVTCVKWGPDQVKVFLEVNSSFGGASVTPPSMVFTGVSGSEETESFSVSTRVPQGTSSSITGTITVGGYWIQGGLQYQIAPISNIIIIEPYYKMDITIDETTFSVEPGKDAEIGFNVANEGNCDDIYKIEFEDREELQNLGFKVPALMEVSIREDANKDIKLEISTPQNASGIYPLKLCVTSKWSEYTDFVCRERMSVSLEVQGEGYQNEETAGNPVEKKLNNLFSSPLFMVLLIITSIIWAVMFFLKRRRSHRATT